MSRKARIVGAVSWPGGALVAGDEKRLQAEATPAMIERLKARGVIEGDWKVESLKPGDTVLVDASGNVRELDGMTAREAVDLIQDGAKIEAYAPEKGEGEQDDSAGSNDGSTTTEQQGQGGEQTAGAEDPYKGFLKEDWVREAEGRKLEVKRTDGKDLELRVEDYRAAIEAQDAEKAGK